MTNFLVDYVSGVASSPLDIGDLTGAASSGRRVAGFLDLSSSSILCSKSNFIFHLTTTSSTTAEHICDVP